MQTLTREDVKTLGTQLCVMCQLEPADKYCHHCEGRFLSTLGELHDLRETLETDEDFMAQFQSYREFVDYYVFEALVRMCSPFTGMFYESVTTLKDAVGFGRQSIINSLNRLDERNLIEYFDVDKKSIANRNAPILKVSNTPDLAAPVYDARIVKPLTQG